MNSGGLCRSAFTAEESFRWLKLKLLDEGIEPGFAALGFCIGRFGFRSRVVRLVNTRIAKKVLR
jgi:hypothetical protein